jgi:hypothetical protein
MAGFGRTPNLYRRAKRNDHSLSCFDRPWRAPGGSPTECEDGGVTKAGAAAEFSLSPVEARAPQNEARKTRRGLRNSSRSQAHRDFHSHCRIVQSDDGR